MKNKEQKSFVIYTEYRELAELLSIADRGRLFTAILEYCTTGEVSVKLGGTAQAVFISIRQSLDRDAEKYKRRCEMNRENGKRGGRPKGDGKAADNESVVYDGQADEGLPGDSCDTDVTCDPMTGEVCEKLDTGMGITGENDNICAETDEKYCAACDGSDNVETGESTQGERRPEDITGENFERFFAAYPKKTHRSDARLTWLKINPTSALTQRMINAIEIQKYSQKWRADDGKYIPSPNRWLLSEGWIYELDPQELHRAEATYKATKAMEMAISRQFA